MGELRPWWSSKHLDLQRYDGESYNVLYIIHVLTSLQSLNKDYNDRLKACKKLEKAISKLIRQVVKAKREDDRAREKAHAKELKTEAKEKKLEEKEQRREQKALEKRRKEGEQEAIRAQREYEIAHGMTPSATSGNKSRFGLGLRVMTQNKQAANGQREEDTPEEDDQSPSTVGHTSGYGRPSNSSSRPLRQRTITSEMEAGRLPPSPTISQTHSNVPSLTNEQNDPETILDTYVPPEKRPHHRLGFLGLLGQNVDTIEWYKVHIPISTLGSIRFLLCIRTG